MYKYFISYNHLSDSGYGYGNVEVNIDFKIKSIQDIEKVSRLIEEEKNFPERSVAILFYRRF